MTNVEKIYHSYKNKTCVYYLTANEENKLNSLKANFFKALSPAQQNEFNELEKCFNFYKELLAKEIIDYTINYRD